MAEYFDELVDIKGRYIRKPIEQTTKVTKIKVILNIMSSIKFESLISQIKIFSG